MEAQGDHNKQTQAERGEKMAAGTLHADAQPLPSSTHDSVPSSSQVPTCAFCSSTSSLSSCAQCGAVSYCSREHQLSHWSVHRASCFRCTVRESAHGAGAGLWCTKRTVAGERIVAEKPLIVVPRSSECEQAQAILQQRFETLSPAQQSTLLSFTDAHAADAESTLLGRCLTNQLPLQPDERGAMQGGVFELICRANHSCLPKAEYSWSESAGKGMLHATKDIEAGQEIHISYLSAACFLTLEERRQHMQEGFKFECACSFCSALLADPAAAQVSDSRRQRMRHLTDELMDPRCALRPAWSQRAVAELQSLFEAEGFGEWSSPLGRAYFRLFQILVCHPRFLDAATSALRRARDIYATTRGKDSVVVQQYEEVLRDPRAHPDFGALDGAPDEEQLEEQARLAAEREAEKKRKKNQKKRDKKKSAASDSAAIPAPGEEKQAQMQLRAEEKQ